MKPRTDLVPNTAEFETIPFLKETGFREYDLRWLYPSEINLQGIQLLGQALGNQMHEMGIEPRMVVGHDYRSYSQSIKQALIVGLMSAGVFVYDVGLCLSPMAYFAQFELDVPAVAMVTASHNENGWTGVKVGFNRPLTHGPDEMKRLKEIVYSDEVKTFEGGGYAGVENLAKRYIEDLVEGREITRKIRAVVATGNGTAGLFAPEALAQVGIEVIPLLTNLDYTFPHYNPNPEDMKMLHAVADAVKEHNADIGFCFDGDGDRCGVVDNKGNEIFADKMAVILGRDLASVFNNCKFVVDVKSTGLFSTDPVLKSFGVVADYWKTGHSYMKRRVNATDALAGFEKSGHYFFNEPIGRGYDDGILSALVICQLLDRMSGSSLSDLSDDLPKTWSSPTMSPYCPDTEKYGVVDAVTDTLTQFYQSGQPFMGQKIVNVVTVNGVRITLEDGTWGLVRASSNKPNLVVVVESPVSEDAMKKMFLALDGILQNYPSVGEYDQHI